MIYKIDCGLQSVTSRELREALKGCNFTGIRIKDLGKNDFHVELLEVVKPGELSAVLGRKLRRDEPVGKYTGHMDPIRVEIIEEEENHGIQS